MSTNLRSTSPRPAPDTQPIPKYAPIPTEESISIFLPVTAIYLFSAASSISVIPSLINAISAAGKDRHFAAGIEIIGYGLGIIAVTVRTVACAILAISYRR